MQLNSTIGARYSAATGGWPVNLSKEAQQKIKQDPAGFMYSLVKQQYSMYKKEIAHWIAARQEFENIFNPQRIQYLQLCRDVMTDSFIFGQVRNRIDRVLNKPFRIVSATGEELPLKKKFFKKKWFYDYAQLAMQAKFYGHTLIYFNEIQGGQIKKVDHVWRDHVIPEKKIIVKMIYDLDGVDYTQNPLAAFCIGVGNDHDLGLFEKAIPLYILKKHSWQSWDQFEEMFGIPIRIAKTASQDKRVLGVIEDWLRDLGSAAYGMFPADTELEIKESTRSDAYQVFEQKRVACNEELAILFNGQFETSSKSGSRAKAESVINNTQTEITNSDLRDLYHLTNDELIPRMAAMGGYDIAEDDEFEWDNTEVLLAKDRVLVYKSISDMGFELDQKDVEKSFGVVITGKKAPVSLFGATPDPDKEEKEPDPEDPKKKDPEKDPNDPANKLINMHKQIIKLYALQKV